MCGILGILQRTADIPELDRNVLDTLHHRGPDGRGLHRAPHVALGHTRLSIIDLSNAAGQPMQWADGRYTIVFNGEIYNYLELRAALLDAGARFATASDTEVILAAYHAWGRGCVERFRGMFAFALWDAQDRTLFMARDRCGERPLFYCRTPQRVCFASELKALLPLLPPQHGRPALDPAVVDMYLHYQYVPEPWTLLRGVHKLPAAHTLTLTPDCWDAEPVRYWDVERTTAPPALASDTPADMPGILDCIRRTLDDAVQMTLRSDVPVGVALSGGIDSGAVAVLAQRHYPEPMHAFCVGYPGRPAYDERAQARALAETLGMRFHEVELPVDQFLDFFPELVRIMDEPVADPAAFGHYSVPRAAQDLGIKVLLTGIGGDELFWGYDWVARAVVLNQQLQAHPPGSLLRRLLGQRPVAALVARLAASARTPAAVRNQATALLQTHLVESPADQPLLYATLDDFRAAFRFKQAYAGPALLDLMARQPDNPFHPTAIGPRHGPDLPAACIRLLFDTWLTSNCLTLGDRVSMGASVEARLPFLDVTLIETVMALRSRVPDHALGQKAWLRAALKGILPDDVLTRPKAGFRPPVHEWLTSVVARHGHLLGQGVLVRAGILDADAASRAARELPQQGWPGLFFAYKLVLLEMWWQELVA
ncbi:asparagine synthase (glutamine-hydrolyzing) [Megalodesulfovibrio gigas]|uniref:asparagine synthase (glutamine-hydrolyzing) n=1 Tax=Megalodesulfovibrio gigas (strain ATCC 19364 / DSM 1382 / NCIMB 9332 / VKM B-1759) TaxID=1121448 RepID=T2GFY2_MEGG1|nr:asparagine synthase (glutamine-hydrolyzing) [Megalodesulfovibrio gigas]AGW15233.1 asparagine synthase [Megalodesulfovibrio gigas DSM 1382 = ATCC 19364]